MSLRDEQVGLARQASALADGFHALLEQRSPLVGGEAATLASRAQTLSALARGLELGGLSHHLEVVAQSLAVTPPRREAVAQATRDLSQMCWQLAEESRSARPASASDERQPPSPPRLLSGRFSAPSVEPSPSASKPHSVGGPPSAPVIRSAPQTAPPLIRHAPSSPPVGGRGGSRTSLPRETSHASEPRPERKKFLLGLGKRGKKPKALGAGPGGLLELGKSIPSRRGALIDDLDARLGRVSGEARASRGSTRSATQPPLDMSALGTASSALGSDSIGGDSFYAPAHRPPQTPRPSASDRRPGGRTSALRDSPALWAACGIGLVLLIVVVVLLVGRGGRALDEPGEPAAKRSAEEEASRALPRSRLLRAHERLRALLMEVHETGGEESSELADLIDEEAALIGEAVGQRCQKDLESCDATVPPVAGTMRPGAQLVRQLLADAPVRKPAAAAAPRRLPPWLAGLKLPAVGAHPHPQVKKKLEYYTQQRGGRLRFEQLLFRCGKHQELIEQVLASRGLPVSLMALVMTESACVQDIESPVGARGLWQFMPATARAYHLRVRDGVADERISPTKSSDAATRFLTDLKRKMGSWELTMASYNMGPFGLAARRKRVGPEATFWQLADAGLLPEETANYVPRIQALALILENLEHFGFSVSQRHAPLRTALFEAPPGTRLSQVARAAGTSLARMRDMNPDLVGPTVPSLPGGPFLLSVPRDRVARARDAIGALLSSKDDLCVSSEFDWGNDRLTPRMLAACR